MKIMVKNPLICPDDESIHWFLSGGNWPENPSCIPLISDSFNFPKGEKERINRWFMGKKE